MTITRREEKIENVQDDHQTTDMEQLDNADAGSPAEGTRTSPTSTDQSEPGSAKAAHENLSVSDGDAEHSKPNSPAGMRSTSSRFASIRAAFEQTSPSVNNNPRTAIRSLSSIEKVPSMTEQQKQEYEADIARLKEDLEKEKELRVAYEEKVTALEEEVEELSTALEQRDEQWQAEFEKRSTQLMDESQGRLEVMAEEARSRQDEATNLQKQLLDLKQNVAASTRTESQVSDTTIRQEIEILQHEVQNWVVNHFRRVKIDGSADELVRRLEQVAEAKQLEFLTPIYKAFDSAAKIPIYQATVACYMMEVFDEPYLFGIQSQPWAKRLRQAADSIQAVIDHESYNRWRVMTFDALRRSEGIKESVESSGTGVADMICMTLSALTAAEDSEGWLSALKPITQRAISLAHLIRVQHSQYQFLLPPPGETFDSTTMDDIAEDVDNDAQSTIRCATFPAIVKAGDQQEGSPDAAYVVAKAKVLCYEDDDDES